MSLKVYINRIVSAILLYAVISIAISFKPVFNDLKVKNTFTKVFKYSKSKSEKRNIDYESLMDEEDEDELEEKDSETAKEQVLLATHLLEYTKFYYPLKDARLHFNYYKPRVLQSKLIRSTFLRI